MVDTCSLACSLSHPLTHPGLLALLEEPGVFVLPLILPLPPSWNRVLTANQVPRVSKERLARKVMLVPRVLRAPLELPGLRWVAVSSPRNYSHGAGMSGCRVRGADRQRMAGRPGCKPPPSFSLSAWQTLPQPQKGEAVGRNLYSGTKVLK